MSAFDQTLEAPRVLGARWNWRPFFPVGPRSADIIWVLAFLAPYVAVLLAFVVYPVCFAIWLSYDLDAYRQLFDYPHYWITMFNTLLMVGVGVNGALFLAFLLSGYFLIPGRWIKGLLVIYMLPWALPSLAAFLSLHWMLIGYGGFMNSALEALFGIDGPIWFDSYGLAMGANILAYVWKWMPFWTLVFMAGRMAIPQDVYDAAAVDGATGLQRFSYVTVPMLANLYLICTLLFTLWTIGDFDTTYFVSSGSPALTTEVLGTYAFRMMLDWGYVEIGLAGALSALPVTIPLALLLLRRLQATEVQL
jgi:multiple sugar transport system permease protein